MFDKINSRCATAIPRVEPTDSRPAAAACATTFIRLELFDHSSDIVDFEIAGAADFAAADVEPVGEVPVPRGRGV